MRLACALLAATWMAAPAAAQVTWTRAPILDARTAPAMALDEARQVIVLFGGATSGVVMDDTWEWDGTRWQRREPAVRPPARYQHTMAYDPVRRRVVLFGGENHAPVRFNDTWEWDGTTWLPITPPTSPAPAIGWAMAWHAPTSRVVLCGRDPMEVWEWDGSIWVQRSLPTAPSIQPGFNVAGDTARGRLVLFGTTATTPQQPATWEWDGTTWQQRTVTTSPPVRTYAALAYDPRRARCVLSCGGWYLTGDRDDTWEWDGTAWTRVAAAVQPTARQYHAMAFDPVGGGVLLFGRGSDTWVFDGATWRVVAPRTHPSASSVAMAFHEASARTVLLAGGWLPSNVPYTETWAWDGQAWSMLPLATQPAPRFYAGMAYDVARRQCVLFGGTFDVIPFLGDTWLFDGTAWSRALPATSPMARRGGALCRDDARGGVLLFGGEGPPGLLSDTWLFDGTSWLRRLPPHSPPGRWDHAMAYDAVHGRVVLFGGRIGASPWTLGDTWEWDGTDWIQQQPAHTPTARTGHGMTFDDARGRVVLFGGNGLAFGYYNALGDTWEWDGADWTQRAPLTSPTARYHSALTYDRTREEVVLFGDDAFRADTWAYGPTAAARTIPFGTGCNGTAGVPLLATAGDQRPWLGDTVTLELTRIPPSLSSLLLLGFSRTTWNGIPLPFDLTPLGMPGCSLFVSGDVPIALANGNGAASLPVAVCSCPELLGQSLFAQALVLDPGANRFGATMSNALELRVGGR